MQAFNIQIPTISGFDQKGDTFWLRYTQPIDKFLARAFYLKPKLYIEQFHLSMKAFTNSI
jgi:hypothetical protein